MLKIVRLYICIIAALLVFDAVIPHPAQARTRGVATTDPQSCSNASWTATNTWCVGAGDWTVYNGTVGNSGTACNTGTGSTWNGTCIIAVAASPVGNDGTCKAEPLTAGVTSATLSSFVPLLPCATLGTAQAKLRTNKPDWMLLRKGDTWDGGINGASNGSWSKNGLSAAAPMLLSSYGTGARPVIRRIASTPNIDQIAIASTDTQYLAIVGIELYNAIADPNSGEYLSANLTGDVNAGGTAIDNVTVPSWIQNGYNSTGYVVYASGINGLTGTWSAGSPNTITLSGGTAAFTSTSGLKFQILSKSLNSNIHRGISVTSNMALLHVEDVMLRSGSMNLSTNTVAAQAVVQHRIRKTMQSNAWIGDTFHTGNTTTPTSDQYILFDGNVMDQGSASLDPSNFAGIFGVLDHCYYFHDPGVQYTFKNNILSNCASSAVQAREGGTFFNNLSIANPWAFGFQMVNYSNTTSYNVFDHGMDVVYAYRTVTADSTTCPVSNTCVFYDGQYGVTGSLVSASNRIINISNPGSIPGIEIQGTATSTTSASSTSSPFQVGLTFPSPYTTIQPGVRGDGVKTGDVLMFVQGSYVRAADAGAGGGLYPDAGPAASSTYAANTTVSISNGGGGNAVVTDTVIRGTDEIFQFTSGSPPAGTSLSTDYCTTNVNSGAKTYNYYPATTGTCPGVSANQVNSSASGSGIGRQGSRKFTFSTPWVSNFQQTPIPSWVTVGTSVCQFTRNASSAQNGFSGSNGCTTVSYISNDRLTMFTTDGVATAFQGAGVSTLIFDLPNVNGRNPSFRFGPNNLMVNAINHTGSNGPALGLDPYASYFDISGNYFYNWLLNAGNNVSGGTTPWSGTNTITQVSSVAGSTSYPWASTDAYDATLRGTSFTGTLSDNGNSGSYLDVTGGGGPIVGDTLFAADGSNSVSQYMKVTSQVSSTRWITNKVQAVGPISMISGSYTHFIAQALANSKDSWDARYTAQAANNFIRIKLKCGDSVAYTTPPACPSQ